MRKVIHASVYFVLAFFVMTFFSILLDHKKYIISLILACVICVTFAITDEYHQTFVNGRTGRPLDVAIDSAGSMVGIGFFSTYHLVYKSGYKNALEDEKKRNLNGKHSV